jgi:tripartite-type tricarboxylate transporter receptor subunit TctC
MLRPLFLSAVLAVAPLAARAEFPDQPIRWVVPYPPGGTTEALARIIGDEVSNILGVQVSVDPRPGAAGNIGSQHVAQSPPDGYTILLGTQSSHGTNGLLMADMPHDALTDFAPISMIATAALMLVVNPEVPAESVDALVDWVKAEGGANFASTSPGGGAHIAGEMFRLATGLDLNHIPYAGSGPSRTDVIAGHVPMMFDNIPSSLPFAREGQLRALATTGLTRSDATPDLPTMIELGYDGVTFEGWYAVFAPAGTPDDVVAKLNAAINTALQTDSVVERLESLGLEIELMTPPELAARMAADIDRYGAVIRAANITLD